MSSRKNNKKSKEAPGDAAPQAKKAKANAPPPAAAAAAGSSSSSSGPVEISAAAKMRGGYTVNGRHFTVNHTPMPDDWPAPHTPIDLRVMDTPKASSDTEWWYVNAHVEDANGRKFSAFASFFKMVGFDDKKGELVSFHALTWAIIDADNNRYYSDPLVDKKSPELIKHELDKRLYAIDARKERAIREILDRGNVPLPDRMFEGEVKLAKDSLDLDYSGNTFTKNAEGHYICHCANEEKGISFDLTFVPKKKPIRHGHDGCVAIGRKGDDMMYYFIPRCEVRGSLVINKDERHEVTGLGWYDHEFGGNIDTVKAEGEAKMKANSGKGKKGGKKAAANGGGGAAAMEVDDDEDEEEEEESKGSSSSSSSEEKKKEGPSEASGKADNSWNWIAVQLEDGTDITATTVVETSTRRILDNFAIVVGPDSKRDKYLEMSMTPTKDFISVRTCSTYPTAWDLAVPGADLFLQVEAVFDNQEFVTTIAKPAFWEGRMNVTGKYKGKAIKGLAFVERHGFPESMESMDRFFKTMSKVVRGTIHDLMPLDPTDEQIRDLLANEHFAHYMQGVDRRTFIDTVIKPIRQIVDRGGKAWRSYALLLCIDAVGGDSELMKHWLAFPEIMHVGSLIVDDIQDKSETRRGGPAAHHIYGEPIAINAGTAAYFLGIHLLMKRTADGVLTPELRLFMYDMYFVTLRAGHCGQAFDIHGLDHMMPAATRTGDNERLVKAITCTHRLKSAAPAGNLARMGGKTGGGTEEQTERLGRYMESIGVAFQIIDDVLNLRGLPGKVRGEDIMAGKVTYPVALAMSDTRLKTRQEREHLWNVIKSKPQDRQVVDATIERIEQCNALRDSVKVAEDMVEEAWEALNKVLPDSIYKANLRAFGWYVLQRHY